MKKHVTCSDDMQGQVGEVGESSNSKASAEQRRRAGSRLPAHLFGVMLFP